MNHARGKFISVEGGEGAGKSTLLGGLRSAVERHGVAVVQTREPGGTVLGEAVRALVLDPALQGMDGCAELFLMFASRAQLVSEVIRPALNAGKWVLCDRFTDATYVLVFPDVAAAAMDQAAALIGRADARTLPARNGR